MQSMRIPKYIARGITSVNRDFFLKNNRESDNGHSSIPLISWRKVCRRKCEGGLGIRKIQDVNENLLAKLGRKVISDP